MYIEKEPDEKTLIKAVKNMLIQEGIKNIAHEILMEEVRAIVEEEVEKELEAWEKTIEDNFKSLSFWQRMKFVLGRKIY